MGFFGEFCAGFILAIVVIWKYVYEQRVKHLRVFPGPKPHLIFGTVLDVVDRTKYLQVLMNYHKTYGKIVKIQLGPFKQGLLVCDQKLMEFILGSRKTIEKSTQYRFLHNWLGTGLLTSGGEKWAKRRKVLTPAFHFSVLEQFIQVFNSVGQVFIEQLYKEKGNKFNVYPYVTLCTLDVICEASMGVSINAQINKDSDYVKSVKRMCRIVVKRLFSAVKNNDFLYRFTKDAHYEKKALEILHSFTDSIIDKKIEEQKKNPLEFESQTDNLGRKKKLAFLDLLLQCKIDGKPLTRADLREEVDTFMFEGHDTTGSAITFLLYCLSNHPEVQEKVFKEQRSIFGEGDIKDVPCTYKDLQDMKYLDLVIKETLRLYPSVPFFGRELLEDIEYDGKILPKGLSIAFVAFAAHRDPEYFQEPEKFIPERFEMDNWGVKHNYSYIPFSAGPRNCIGQKFAMLEMKSLASKVVRNFNILPVPEHELKLNVETILISQSGVFISLEERF